MIYREAVAVPTGTVIMVSVVMMFDKDNPLEVVFRFRTGEPPVDWVFSRDLLQRGMLSPAGGGDVTVTPDPLGFLTFSLVSPEGFADLRIRTRDVEKFLIASYTEVPEHEEYRAVEEELDKFLEGAVG